MKRLPLLMLFVFLSNQVYAQNSPCHTETAGELMKKVPVLPVIWDTKIKLLDQSDLQYKQQAAFLKKQYEMNLMSELRYLAEDMKLFNANDIAQSEIDLSLMEVFENVCRYYLDHNPK